jgi:hypothetical protein
MGGHSFSIEAQRADAVSALAERLTESRQATAVLRALQGLSPVALQGRVTPAGPEDGSGLAVSFTGRAGALTAAGSGRLDAARRWTEAGIELTARQRGLIFRGLGLPEPAEAQRDAVLSARLSGSGVRIELTGGDGLRAEASGSWGAEGGLDGPLAVTVRAPGLAAVAPGRRDRRGLVEQFLLEGRVAGEVHPRFP